MVRLVVLFSLISFVIQPHIALSWQQLGDDLEPGRNGFINVSPTGEIHFAYRKNGDGRIHVKYWNDFTQEWEAVGGSASVGTSWQPHFAYKDEEIWLANRNYGVGTSTLNIQRWINGAWENFFGCSDSACRPDVIETHEPRMAIGNNPSKPFFHLPLLVVNDGYPPSSSHYDDAPPNQRDEKPSILAYNNGVWDYLGGRNTSKRITPGPTGFLDLDMDPRSQMPVVSYSSQGRVEAKKYNRAANRWDILMSHPAIANNTTLCYFRNRPLMFFVQGTNLKAVSHNGPNTFQIGGVIDDSVHMGTQNWIQSVSCGVFEGPTGRNRLFIGYRKSLSGGGGVFRVAELVQGQWVHLPDAPQSQEAEFVSMAVDSNGRRIVVSVSDYAFGQTQKVYAFDL